MITFKDWILQNYKDVNNAIGDLANDIFYDDCFPQSCSKNDILEYLENCGACDNALIAFNRAWELYKAQ